jgi:RNase P protein component
MLPASLRFPLRNHPDFFDTARRKRFPHLLVFFRPETANTPLRFSVIVKKSHGSAPERATYKRRVRAAIIALSQKHPEFFSRPSSLVLMPLGAVQSQSIYEQEIQQFLESAS